MKPLTFDSKYGVLALGYTVVIFWLGSEPVLGGNRHDFASIVANLFHVPLYTGHAYWVLQAISGGRGLSANPIPRAVCTVLLSGLVAVLDEWRQQFVPGREPSLWDLLLDGMGIAALLFMCARGARVRAHQ